MGGETFTFTPDLGKEAELMAIDLFLKIEGITGESQDARHRGAIELQSFSFGEQESGHAGGAEAPGRSHFRTSSSRPR